MPNTRIGTLIPGHTWLEGVGAPASTLGSKFQYYQDTVTRDLYQKQDAVTWLKIGNLSGNWLSGSGVPDPSLGIIGNFYVDTATGDIYEKTDPITWELRGTMIPVGVWHTGNGLPDDNAHNIEDFYTDLDTGFIYEKTAFTTWELRGTMIPTGVWRSGNGYPTNGDGNIGDFFEDKDTGNCYEKVADNTWELRGDLVPPVVTGIWTSGSGAPTSVIGNVGDFYEDIDSGDVYEKTDLITWTIRGDLIPPPPPTVSGVWYAGTVDPSTGIGSIGDFYVNTTSKNVYYQSDVDVWDLIGNLGGGGGSSVGIWLSGNGVPDPSLSDIGNWYVDMDLWEVYKKTAALTWSFYGSIAPVNLVRDLIGSVFVPAGYTMTQYHIELDVGAVFTVDGRLYYRTLDTTNGTLDSTNGTLALI
jgi:hypothetical protein